ncbi:acyltransferase family protein [Marinicella sp. W31]|uniref:acyltransferase family protein n=1 Tax=Marinicella sp. W31 TaxID=3023713 RepID=UPI0037581704
MNTSKKTNSWINYFNIGKHPGRIPELDGFRAFAIILVLFRHFADFYQDFHASYYRNIFGDSILHNFMQNGWLGVDLFFVLSGYLIFYHLLSVQNKPDRAQTYGRYALKRILRTFPLYYAIIALIFLGLIPFYQAPASAGWDQLITHLVFLQDYKGTDILVPLWSLASEEKFYLLAPILLWLVSYLPTRKSIIYICIFIASSVLLKTFLIFNLDEPLPYDTFFWHFRAPFHYAITSILIGVIIALLSQHQAPKWLPKLGLISALIVILLLLIESWVDTTGWHRVNIMHLLFTMACGLLVWTAVKHSGMRTMRFLTGRILRIIAVLSYSLYLVHYTVLPWTFQFHKQHIRSEEPWIHGLSFFAIYIGLSFLASLLLHYLIEKPFLILKDRL